MTQNETKGINESEVSLVTQTMAAMYVLSFKDHEQSAQFCQRVFPTIFP